jgi:FkbM family methyltransferase
MLRTLGHYIDVIRKNPRPIRFMLGRILVLTGLSERFVIEQALGYKLRFFPSNLSEQLWVNPTLRDEPLAFFAAYLKPGDVVVDVGANIGDTCIVCARLVAPGGTVYSFEPHPRVYGWLQHNVQLNALANAVLANLALGEADGTVAFSDDRRDDMNRVIGGNGGRLHVPVRTLDAVLPLLDGVALLKIDVEGFEIFVLKGGARTLAKTQAVHIEVGQAHFAKYGYATSDLLALLEAAGFLLFRLGRDREIERIDALYVPIKVENIVAARDPAELRRRLSQSDFRVVEKR